MNTQAGAQERREFSVHASDLPPGDGPVVVSFFYGDAYYRAAADALVARLRAFSTPHYICELVTTGRIDWHEACKQKIHFIRETLSTLGRGVFWIDVDTSLVGDPAPVLAIRGSDIAFFLRGFAYLPTFDFASFSRLVHPGYVLYSNTAGTRAFVEVMATIADGTTEPVTDDYVLHEALFSGRHALAMHLFAPRIVAKSSDDLTAETIFVHGDSGNVPANRAKVVQHEKREDSRRFSARALSVATELLMRRKSRSSRRAAAAVNAVALELDPRNLDAYRRAVEFHGRKSHRFSPRHRRRLNELVAFGKTAPELRRDAFALDFERKARKARFAEAEAILAAGEATGDQAVRNALLARKYVYWLDRRAKALGIPSRKRTRLWWWRRPDPGNWGDIVNPYVVEKLTGIPPKFVEGGRRLLAIGSVLRYADADATVWGTGASSRDVKVNIQAEFRAVRGPITRSLVLAAGGRCPEVYGDPALLLPLLYEPARPVARAKLGLILHHNHLPDHLDIAGDVRLIDIRRVGYDQIEAFLDEVCACAAIISTSLHGLIAAHAYGIPTRWADVDDGASGVVPGDGMKFLDYFQSVGLDGVTGPLVLRPELPISAATASECTELPTPERLADLRKGLLASAPFPLLERFRRMAGTG